MALMGRAKQIWNVYPPKAAEGYGTTVDVASLDPPLSVRIPEPLLTDFKIVATRRHLKYKAAVILAIKAWMADS